MPFDPLLIIVTGALIGGLITGAIGFGSGPIVVAIWLLILEPQVAAPLLALNACFYVPASLRVVWHAVQPRRLWPLALGAAVGTPLGAWVLTSVSAENLKLAIGIGLSLYAAGMLIMAPSIVVRPRTRLPDAAVGVAGGFVGGAAAMPGVVWTVWTGMRGWTKDEQRAVYQPLNTATVFLSTASFATAGLLTREVATLTLWVLPTFLIGVAIGMPLYRRISERVFRNVILATLGLIGSWLIIDAAFS